MDKSLYTRPNKPRHMPVTDRKQAPERELVSLPALPIVHASTECFTTPRPIVDLMLEYAGIESGHKILEPSAGTGSIANILKENFPDNPLDVCELDISLQNILKEQGHLLRHGNFLEFVERDIYDRILRNPPFKQLQDIDHVRHAFKLLAPGGRLVAIMGAGAFFNSRNKGKDFRAWIAELDAEYFDLPSESFKDSGTSANTKLLTLDKE